MRKNGDTWWSERAHGSMDTRSGETWDVLETQ